MKTIENSIFLSNNQVAFLIDDEGHHNIPISLITLQIYMDIIDKCYNSTWRNI